MKLLSSVFSCDEQQVMLSLILLVRSFVTKEFFLSLKSFNDVSRVIKGCLKKVSRVFQGSFQSISRKFQGNIKSV